MTPTELLAHILKDTDPETIKAALVLAGHGEAIPPYPRLADERRAVVQTFAAVNVARERLAGWWGLTNERTLRSIDIPMVLADLTAYQEAVAEYVEAEASWLRGIAPHLPE